MDLSKPTPLTALFAFLALVAHVSNPAGQGDNPVQLPGAAHAVAWPFAPGSSVQVQGGDKRSGLGNYVGVRG